MTLCRDGSFGSKPEWPAPSPSWSHVLATVIVVLLDFSEAWAMAVTEVGPNVALLGITTEVGGREPLVPEVAVANVLPASPIVTLTDAPKPPPLIVREPPGATYSEEARRYAPEVL